jgi:maltose O-acetyltransferase
MQPVKRLWWFAVAELRVLVLWWLSVLPGRIGLHMRRCFMGRFLKAIGRHTVIQAGSRITSPGEVSIGSHCNLAQGVFITGGGGVTIGNWVGFGPDVKIWSVNHRFSDPDRPWMLQGSENKPVVIEDDVWLAANVFVLPGVTIGKGAIVSACSVVSKSIPPYALVAGNPARVIGWRKAPTTLREGSSGTDLVAVSG